MILLDTNALVWTLSHHARSKPLFAPPARLYVSPVALLELAYLVEVGRVRLTVPGGIERLSEDPRFTLDDPPMWPLFRAAFGLSWTRDPFDRLIVAHAASRRFRLATGDRHLLEHLPASAVVAL